ncbi:hypothetical protein QU39_00360, partial [Staphylococcus aureus]
MSVGRSASGGHFRIADGERRDPRLVLRLAEGEEAIEDRRRDGEHAIDDEEQDGQPVHRRHGHLARPGGGG